MYFSHHHWMLNFWMLKAVDFLITRLMHKREFDQGFKKIAASHCKTCGNQFINKDEVKTHILGKHSACWRL